MSRADAKAAAMRAIDRQTRDIVGLARRVYGHPEVGFEETRTARLVASRLQRLGIPVEQGIALTGVRGVLSFGAPGPTIAVIGELDAVRVPGHPGAAAATGAAHACGHHAQLGMMLGVAAALRTPEVADGLAGRVVFIAAPAEEFIDVGRRWQRRQAGELGLLSGKQEMIRLGTFDDVDMAMMVHTSSGGEPGRFIIGGGSTGHVVHHVRFLGRASHAGGAPDEGVNALQAALVALNAVNAQRETFENRNVVRVHGIITSGGAAVNSVPAEVVYEGRVRGRDMEVVDGVAERVGRCFRAGALALGAEVEVTSIPGYMPLRNDPGMLSLFKRNAIELRGGGGVVEQGPGETRGGSTDMGDLSQIMPVIHPYVAAARGAGHGDDYLITDYDLAVVAPAKVMAATVIDLLSDGAQGAEGVLREALPPMTSAAYLGAQEQRLRVARYKGA